MNLDDMTKDVLRGVAGVCELHRARLPEEALAALYLRIRSVLRDAPASARSADLAGELALAALLELAALDNELLPTVLPQLREQIAMALAAPRREPAAVQGGHR